MIVIRVPENWSPALTSWDTDLAPEAEPSPAEIARKARAPKGIGHQRKPQYCYNEVDANSRGWLCFGAWRS